MGMSSPPHGNYDEERDMVVVANIFDDGPVIYEFFSRQDQYQLALESIFRWTLRRDEISDAQIVRAIKKITTVALEDV